MSDAATVTPNNMPAANNQASTESTGTPPSSAASESQTSKADNTGTAATGGLSVEDRAELERLRGLHKDEQKFRREATENHRDAEAYRQFLAGLGVDGKAKDFDPQAAVADLKKQFETEREARIRAEVARAEDVDPAVLQGTTEDEMRASAQRFNTLVDAAVEKKANGVAPAAAPAGEVTSNQKVDGPKQIASRDQLKTMSRDQIIEAHKKGQLDDQIAGRTT